MTATISATSASPSTARRRGFGPAAKLADWVALTALRLLFGAFLISLWWLAAHFEWADHTVTSSPGEVGNYLWTEAQGTVLWINLWATVRALAIAYVLASAVGITIGVGLALLPRVERVLQPYLDAMNAMPRIALAPIFVVSFGIDIRSKIALAFSVVVFLLITSSRAGVKSADPDVLRLAKVLGANRRQLFAKVLLPVAVPSIFGGLRLGVIFALLGVVTMELIASQDGMGHMLQQQAAVFATDGIYGVLIVLALAASLLNVATSALERWLLRWQGPGSF